MASAKTTTDVWVQRRLAALCARVKSLELLRASLLCGIAVLGYALTAGLFELNFGANQGWPFWVRLGGSSAFLALFAFLSGRLVFVALGRVNPYYAARQLEATIPDAKNSLINWLDLHRDEQVPSPFRRNLHAAAYRDLKSGDEDQAVPARGNWILLAVFGVLFAAFLIFFVRHHGQFLPLMQRAFLPLHSVELPKQTQITLLQPEKGDIDVNPNQAVTFSAQIDGRVPTGDDPRAPALLYRYEPGDAFLRTPLQLEHSATWSARLLGDQVRNGFTYKLTAGDAETPEYQVRVRPRFQARQVEVHYLFRPYRKLSRETTTFPNEFSVFPSIQAHRGTEVELVVHSNRPLRQASVEVVTDKSRTELAGQIFADDASSFRTRFTLERSGQFRILLTSLDWEPNSDRAFYPMTVLVDDSPQVALTVPGKDISLPVNGTLAVEGSARDDFGVAALALQMQLHHDGMTTPLAPQPYRKGKPLQFDDGTFPTAVEYRDLVLLDQLRHDGRQAPTLRAGMILEYWLEAHDNADFPSKGGNVGRSAHFKVALTPPADSKKEKAQRQQAQDQQKKHEQQQDQQRDQQQKQDGGKGSEGKGKEPNESQGQNSKDESGKQPPDPREQKLQEQQQKLEKALQEQDQQKQRGEAKGENAGEDRKAESKSGENQSGDGNGAESAQSKDQPGKEQQSKGDSKGDGAGGGGNSQGAGESKGKGEAANTQSPNPPNASKGEKGDKQGNAKPAPQQPAGSAKDEGESGSQEKSAGAAKGNDKAGPPPQDSKQASGNGPLTQIKPTGQAKEEKKATGNEQLDPNVGEAKGEEMIATRSDAKDGGKPEKGSAPLGEIKPSKGPGVQAAKAAKAAKGDADPKTADGESAGQAKGDGEGIPKREATAEEVGKMIEQLKKDLADGKGKEAADQLEKAFEQIGEPQLKEQAREALANAGVEPKSGKGQGSNADNSPGAGPGSSKTPVKQEGDGETGDAQVGRSGPSKNQIGDDPMGQQANREFANRGGNLQLEDLRRRVTPEVLRKAGMTDAEWQQFLRDAKAFDDQLAKAGRSKGQPKFSRGGASTLPSMAPAEEQRQVQTPESLQGQRSLPPPELRDALKRFAGRP